MQGTKEYFKITFLKYLVNSYFLFCSLELGARADLHITLIADFLNENFRAAIIHVKSTFSQEKKT